MGRPFSLPSQMNFPISFKPKVATTEFFWKMESNLVFQFWSGRYASFPQKPVVKAVSTNEMRSNKCSFSRVLPMFWPVAAEQNLSLSQNIPNS